MTKFKTRIIRSSFRKSSGFQYPEETYDSWVLLAIQQGVFSYKLAGLESGECGPGEVIFCPPSTLLQRQALTGAIDFCFIEFDPVEVQPLSGKQTARDGTTLLRAFSEFHRLSLARDEGALNWLPHLLHELIYQCQGVSQLPEKQPVQSDPLMEQAKECIQEKWQDPDLSLREIAQRFNLSPVQFTRRFRAVHGSTPSAYLMRLRLDQVRHWIVDTEVPLTEIAEKCGYRDAFYLSRVFKSVFGIAPAFYRKRHRI